MDRQIYSKLVETAQMGKLIFYGEIASLANLNTTLENDRRKMGELLGEISKYEVQEGRPMLSAVAVHQDPPNRPGKGFFTLAKELGLWDGREDEVIFYAGELRRVYDHWQHNTP